MKRIIFITLAIFTVFLSGCSINIDGPGSSDINIGTGHRENRSADYRQPAGGIERLEVANGVGDIRIEAADVKEIEVHSRAEVRSKDEETSKDILDNVKVRFERNGDSMRLKVITGSEAEQEFWAWLKRTYHSASVSVDLDIKIPDDIKELSVDNGVGNTSVLDYKGSVSTTTGTGDVSLMNAVLSGDSTFKAGTGNINVKAEIKQANMLKVDCGVGNITIDLPQEAGFDISAKTGVGNIEGSLIKNSDKSIAASVNEEVNGGGTELRLVVGTGNITVD